MLCGISIPGSELCGTVPGLSLGPSAAEGETGTEGWCREAAAPKVTGLKLSLDFSDKGSPLGLSSVFITKSWTFSHKLVVFIPLRMNHVWQQG